MSFGSFYQEADYNTTAFKEGRFDCILISAELKMSSTKKEMVEMEFSIPNQGKLKYWLVDDQSSQEAHDRTNANMTRFFDCFKIRRGNFNINQWVGKKGIIEIAKGSPNADGKVFFEIKKLIVNNQQNAYQKNQAPYGNTQQLYQQQQTQSNSAYQPRNNPPQNNGYVPQDDMDNIPF